VYGSEGLLLKSFPGSLDMPGLAFHCVSDGNWGSLVDMSLAVAKHLPQQARNETEKNLPWKSNDPRKSSKNVHLRENITPPA
jgi:hypothetical protein